MAPAENDALGVAKPFGPRWVRSAFLAAATAYLALLFLDGAGAAFARNLTPPALHYFAEIAGLFPRAETVAIDYRAEGFVCSTGAWEEIDTRVLFPLRPNDKENRFYRTMFFYRKSPPTMRALERYFLAGDSAIGGVRLLSLRIPFPPPGSSVARYESRPLSAFPREQRQPWFVTPLDEIRARCGTQPR